MSTLIPVGMGLDGLDLVLPEPAIVDAPSGAITEAERSAAKAIPTTCIETIGGDPATAIRLSFQIKVF